MKQPAYVSHFLKQYKPKIQAIPIDKHTQTVLTSLLRKRLQRDQVPLIAQLTQLIDDSQDNKTSHISQILKLCYKNARYADHKEIQWFLKAKLDNWPVESQRVILENERTSMDFKARNLNTLKTIKFPKRQERTLPSLVELFKEEQEEQQQLVNPEPSKITNDIEPLDLSIAPEQTYENIDQQHNATLTKVLQLFHFLRNNTSMLHSRNLTSPIAQIPLTPLGQPVATIRHKNIIKKKISYIRQIFYTIPPLDKADFEHLQTTLDGFYAKEYKSEMDLQVIKHYEQFLRKSYCIGEDFTFVKSKYAYIRTPRSVQDRRYFTVKESLM